MCTLAHIVYMAGYGPYLGSAAIRPTHEVDVARVTCPVEHVLATEPHRNVQDSQTSTDKYLAPQQTTIRSYRAIELSKHGHGNRNVPPVLEPNSSYDDNSTTAISASNCHRTLTPG
jgi:hypothetical protein